MRTAPSSSRASSGKRAAKGNLLIRLVRRYPHERQPYVLQLFSAL
nr:MAG TPA: hypothetical protein [Caudoviricetes sp.]